MIVKNLPQSEKDLISRWIEMYGISDRDRNNFPFHRAAPIDRVLREWEDAKEQHLWKMFGEKFILEREVSYQRPKDMIYGQMCEAIEHGAMKKFRCDLCDKVENYYDYWTNEHRKVRRLFSIDALIENRYSDTSVQLTFDDKTYKLNYNGKIMKILNHLAKHFDLTAEFEQFRIAHSQILNQKALNGTLCISIHPFDYMTMSDNTYDWDSCMSWMKDGCYRTGTVEMMNSPYVIVAYLKGEDPFRIYDYTWSGNKKWRELFIVHPNAICNIKPYPYLNETLSNIVLDWLRELAAFNLGWDVSYDAVEFNLNCPFDYGNGRSYRYNFETEKMYNDFDTGNTKHRIIIPQNEFTFDTECSMTVRADINISGESICMCCGTRWWPESGHENQVLCPSCDPGPCCSECGTEDEEENMYYVEGDWLCEYCYENLAGRCQLTDEYYYKDNMIKVYLTAIDNNVDYYDELRYCYVHHRYADPKALMYENAFYMDNFRTATVNGKTIYYVNADDCRDWVISDFFDLYNSMSRIRYIANYEDIMADAAD